MKTYIRTPSVLWVLIAAMPSLASANTPLPMEEPARAQFVFEGKLGDRVTANVDHWLKRALVDNPGMLGMLATRDAGPEPDLLPWAGEFIANYLGSGVLAMRMSTDPKLKTVMNDAFDRLLALQADDGYLGPWPKKQRLKGQWDLWGHYQMINALLRWHQYTGDDRALMAAKSAGDLICETFLGTGLGVVDVGSPNQNFAILHAMLMLHRATGEDRYRQMSDGLMAQLEASGAVYKPGLQGVGLHRIRGGQWHTMHIAQSLAEYYAITGKDTYKTAFLNLWHGGHRTDLHNTGGFTTSEHMIGNPYDPGAIETCCLVAWIAMSIDALRLSADMRVADTLESALLNAAAGSQDPSGRWWTYDTPMNGRKRSSTVSINFQARPSTPELNCCSVNGPRALGEVSRWAIMHADDALVLNYYGPYRSKTELPNGSPITVTQKTDYPIGGRIDIQLPDADGRRFPLWLRIPEWSNDTRVTVNGKRQRAVAGKYLKLTRAWRNSDRIVVTLDMRLRHIEGGRRFKDHMSVYRGPLLLAADPRFNPSTREPKPPHGWVHPEYLPMPLIGPNNLRKGRTVAQSHIDYGSGTYRPWVLVRVPAERNRTLTLVDFASAGFPGTSYSTWLRMP